MLLIRNWKSIIAQNPKFEQKTLPTCINYALHHLGKKLRATMKNCESLEQFWVILSETFFGVSRAPPPKKRENKQKF